MNTAQNIGGAVGTLVGLLFLGLLPYRFLRNGLREDNKSRRQANLALACGLSILVFLPLFGAAWIPRPLMSVVGGAQVLLGISGVALAIASLRSRAKDERTGRTGAVLGGLISLLHALAGLSAVLVPFLTDIRPDPGTAWTYTDPAQGFHVKLPSSRWRQVQGPKGETAFAHAAPRMQAIILSTKEAQTLESYEAAAASHREHLDRSKPCRSTVVHRRGTTPSGNPFTYSTCAESSPSGGKTFVATSIVFCKERGLLVLILCEGQSKMLSSSFQDLENESFQAAASYILESVE
ncbi:hypothetical protein ACMHYB_14255 [Sorangium sp. So ce1128]